MKLLVCIWTAAIIFVSSGEAATRRVPSEYPTIQEALDVSTVADTVLVEPGIYSDYTVRNNRAGVAFVPDGVSVVSEFGSEVTTIDLSETGGWAGSGAFGCSNHASGLTTIEGFRVTGNPPSSASVSTTFCAGAQVRNCVFEVASGGVPNPSETRRGIDAFVSSTRVTDCTFIGCAAPSGAGILDNSGSLVVEGCSFVDCVGQAIRAYGDLGSGPFSLEVRDCAFQNVVGNSSSGAVSAGSRPGGILVDGCLFREVSVFGGAGAALVLSSATPTTVSNNVFSDVSLTDGACVIYLIGGVVEVAGNTFANLNQVPMEGGVIAGGGLDGLVLTHNIFANTSGVPVVDVNVTPATACNVLWNNDGGLGFTPGETDRVADPLFCAPEDGDYSLQATSPCLPSLSLGCDLIGALGQGCGAVSTTPMSWGSLKATFR